jgi:hypothetical protein
MNLFQGSGQSAVATTTTVAHASTRTTLPSEAATPTADLIPRAGIRPPQWW